MCLIVHKPAGRALPAALLRSAAAFNPHGAGLVALPATREAVIRRAAVTRADEILGWAAEHVDDECVLHFRYRTRGGVDIDNTHPLPVTQHIHLFHNGTLAVDSHTPERSDSWHLARDFLAPVLTRRPALLGDATFGRMLAAAIGRLNRVVLVDTQARQVVVVNREAGLERDGLWLSNARWFDPRVLDWSPAARPATPAPRAVSFLS
ncbi:MAG: hypothetical protein AB7I32_17710 [Gammaproteobacteria bacterium]